MIVDEVFKWAVTSIFIGSAIGINALVFVWLKQIWDDL